MALKPLSDLIQTSLQSNEAFPVDFEEAWRLSGYPTRRGALKKLTDNFVEKTHYISFKQPNSQHEARRVKTVYWLSTECLKCFAVLAGTQKGREINLQLIESEKLIKVEWCETITKITLAIRLLLTPCMNQPRMRRDRYFNILSADYGQAIALFKRFATKNTEDMLPLLQLETKLKKLIS